MKDDWLWDGEGEPDRDVARLEEQLRPLRYDRPAPELKLEPPARSGRAWLALGAAVLAAAAVVLLVNLPRPVTFAVEALAGGCGTPDCELGIREWLVTDSESTARVRVADIGIIDVAPNSRLRLVASGPTEHRLHLAEGRIEAHVSAPPRLLVVETPSAIAVDLGCAYTLEVTPSGDGRLAVTTGLVALESKSHEVRVPAGATAIIVEGTGPTTPLFDDTDPQFRAGVEAWHGGGSLDDVLAAARPRDTLSLWNMLGAVAPADRERVFDRIAALAPGVLPTDRDAVLALQTDALEILWRDLLPVWYPSEAP